MQDMRDLAALIRDRNRIARRITAIIGRPAQIGHIGEFSASKVFDIHLEASAVAKGIDGAFASGPLRGQTVNIKFYGKREGVLDVREDALPDYFLVLTGPQSTSMTSRSEVRPWAIDWAFLFNARHLVGHLHDRGVKIGVATSVIREQWDQAEVYPNPTNPILPLREEQRQLLQLFSSTVTTV